ncbi:replicative DNA helicase [Clostridium tetani]|uniref:replicative DNA helicase n=1 Tax=Clostridium tetani TaxID=1513 RepID=UPI00100B4A50|nr:replicative DNA helicase [Clostridium tetani]RXM72221.1 hypothetical protein DP143_10535 [Clostridium tetani]
MKCGDVIELIQNNQIEQIVLGAILKNETLFSNIEIYNKDLFYNTMHQKIFETMKRVKREGQAIDLITVSKVAKEQYKDISITYISELFSSVITTANFETHINLLVDYKNKRDILKTIQSIDFTESSDDILNVMYKLLDGILTNRENTESTKEALFKYIENIYSPQKDIGLDLGLNTIDRKTGGILPGQLITIAGYTGMGKSILVTQIILNMLRANRKIDLFSVEMSRKEIFNKLSSNACNIDFNDINNRKTTEKQKEDITQFISTFLAAKDFEIYEYMDDINKIVNQIKKDKLNRDIDIVFIDLINRIIDSNSKEQNRAIFLSSITRRLKVLAGKLKIPIVITAQINRSVESRQDKAPTLSDIKESGGIAEDSDYVFGLYRNKDLEDHDVRKELNDKGLLNYHAKDADINPECIEIHVLKSRNFQGFKAGFYWKGQYQRIGNMEV